MYIDADISLCKWFVYIPLPTVCLSLLVAWLLFCLFKNPCSTRKTPIKPLIFSHLYLHLPSTPTPQCSTLLFELHLWMVYWTPSRLGEILVSWAVQLAIYMCQTEWIWTLWSGTCWQFQWHNRRMVWVQLFQHKYEMQCIYEQCLCPVLQYLFDWPQVWRVQCWRYVDYEIIPRSHHM